MYKPFLLASLALFFSLPALAQEQVAVLDLRSKGNISGADASILTDRIRSLIVQSGQYQVLERENMDRILREQGFQSTQNCESTDCSLEIGKMLAVRHLITGSASRLGNLYSLSLRIIDVQKGAILREEYMDCLCPLEDLMTRTAPALVAQTLGQQTLAKQPEKQPSSLLADQAVPVRQRYPWLVSLEGGWPRYAGLNLQYNLNPSFALGAVGGVLTGNYTINGYFGGMARYYFNPQDFAGFVDLIALGNFPSRFDFAVIPRIGFEYRQTGSGLSFGMALGMPIMFPYFDIGGITKVDASANLGLAF
ncbi:hypothetical protein COW36_18285 [bacterium (Candidatus Blackallbacteria) CG17_big_fil_post_rev_8_21_14_2_50_48_46]|uniref:DUF2380 domain-containing protein n=1 Tax=bacterium (Candidatus Blackallbacteria) CG17_big_fil_post_rev_8_21_14_2_50_48_46 TaxID=2014261 RepID=A0A2M7G0Y4_9BACT|nr:MAG: hypothetical protein COW64_00450 [bacterium (Candidatus Blackallbacteria) CG18_big_fil_WC_8_21_14_2_50_49_26]PIW15365.1 MAG: hypothetical protein COW36_18285 [bacterium (Candidatus Blackallbacteria) CG17_big_fil_post_rev_8_21_14_2_50_48_46]PIW49774.1 MAG: hypothetical protein COW20_05080 [bacterium (Candidatus Blackallbacteria) CG13_big_fil_rev_8_21_14_2_50_49_14]